MADQEERYDELSQETIDFFMSIYDTKAFSIKIGFKFINDFKMKQSIKVMKLSDMYKFLLNKDALVIINEDLFDKLDEESMKILIEQELDRIEVDFKNGKIKMVQPDVKTFSGILSKYGEEAVLRANQVDKLSAEQKEDMETGFH
jgi:hypothetical protein